MKRTYSISDLPNVASLILENTNSRILLFYGPMGVGKTTLIKELAKQLGVLDTISSPTFSLVNEYNFNGSCLYHFDFYRLRNEAEAMDIGFDEYLDSGQWVFIEWPENIVGILPQNGQKLELVKNSDESRTITIMPMK